MRRLHRLLHDGEHLLTYLLQVSLLAQRGAKGRQHLLGIVLLAIKAPINHVLDTAAHGQEERGNRQCGDDQHDWVADRLPDE